MARLFIAAEISDAVKEKIAAIQKELPPDSIRKVDPKIIHITLKFLGETDESKIPDIKRELALIRFNPISLKCKGVGVFPSEKFIRVIWCGIEQDEGFMRLREE
ncbi:MAG: RNA 2',3'-cyclic phosphodiesterase [Candidatus Micrarchaeia archaeon]